MGRPSWSGCGGRTGPRRWRSRSSSAQERILRPGERGPKMTFRLVHELADDTVLADGQTIDVAVACRVLGVSGSGYYEWQQRQHVPSAKAVEDSRLTETITEIHRASRGWHGSPRVHAELRLGLGIPCGRKRVARLMRLAGLAGGSARRKRRRSGPLPAVHQDLVRRRFVADSPNRCGAPTSPNTPPATGRCTAASSSTCSPQRRRTRQAASLVLQPFAERQSRYKSPGCNRVSMETTRRHLRRPRETLIASPGLPETSSRASGR